MRYGGAIVQLFIAWNTAATTQLGQRKFRAVQCPARFPGHKSNYIVYSLRGPSSRDTGQSPRRRVY